jgi:quercetin 2,3-dioxygenase
VAKGDIDLEAAGQLSAGDAARVTLGGSLKATAGPAGAEVLIWEMHKQLTY